MRVPSKLSRTSLRARLFQGTEEEGPVTSLRRARHCVALSALGLLFVSVSSYSSGLLELTASVTLALL